MFKNPQMKKASALKIHDHVGIETLVFKATLCRVSLRPLCASCCDGSSLDITALSGQWEEEVWGGAWFSATILVAILAQGLVRPGDTQLCHTTVIVFIACSENAWVYNTVYSPSPTPSPPHNKTLYHFFHGIIWKSRFNIYLYIHHGNTRLDYTGVKG